MTALESIPSSDAPLICPSSTTSNPPSNSTISNEPSEFPLFALLPPEIRLKIWFLALAPPRLVPLTYFSSTSPITPSTPRSHRGCTSSATIPVTLHINHESRSVALQQYILSFGLSGGGPSFRLPSKVYFSPRDILYFDQKAGWNEGLKNFVNACLLVNPGGFGQVRRLAVHRGLFEGNAGKGGVEEGLRCFWERVKGKFAGVESVVFVEKGSDGLLEGAEGKEEIGSENEGWLEHRKRELEGMGYGNECAELSCWEEDTFEDKLERVVRGLEEESGWAAPAWRVVSRQHANIDVEGPELQRQTRKEREKALVKEMREMFGHEDVSNAV